MMQFLKSILSSNKRLSVKDEKIEKLEIELESSLRRISRLETQALACSAAIVELSEAINSIAKGTKGLTEEFALITALLQKASENLANENKVISHDADDDGYLN